MIRTATQLKAKVRNLSGGDSTKAQTLIRNFIMERFLERIALSQYRNNFILKGGMLVSAVVGLDTRATMDIDTTVKSLELSKENAVKIESKSGTPTVFSAHLIPVKIGDKLEIEFEAKGKGKANVGVYLYGKSFVASASATVAVDSPNKFTKYKTCVTLKKTPKPYTNARAIFGLIGAGSVTFTDIEVETEK